jgi:hypothetical protein
LEFNFFFILIEKGLHGVVISAELMATLVKPNDLWRSSVAVDMEM